MATDCNREQMVKFEEDAGSNPGENKNQLDRNEKKINLV